MRVIDLTEILNARTPVYLGPHGNRDPAYLTESWATVVEHGYSVHRIEMGTHTGTHLDAPAHFHAGGRTVDQIPPSALVGRATIIDVRAWPRVTSEALHSFSEFGPDEGLVLFIAPETGVPLTVQAVSTVISWRPKLILYAGQFLDEGERFHHNRAWLGAGIPLVTDLNSPAAACVRKGDLLVVAPMPLDGMDGAPCRVFALQGELDLAK